MNSNDTWNLDTADEIKVIKLLVHEPSNERSLPAYLSRISDLNFSTHASEMRYGDTYYFRGTGKNVRVTIVPTITLSALPRQYRKKDWFFVTIYCHPNDERFDKISGYEIVSASQYNI